jgi:hypothetical protein
MDGANPPLSRSYASERDFDVNIDGVAHYGMLPDFVQDLRNLGLTDADLAPLFRSAEDYIELWARCRTERLGVASMDATVLAHLFWGSPSVGVQDTVGSFGAGSVQSRTYPPTTAGLHVAEYRVWVDAAAADTRVQSITVPLDGVQALAYRKGALDHVYVVTSGGIGSVGVDAVERRGRAVTLRFGDGGVGAGASSYFFGLCSSAPVQPATATVVDGAGGRYEVPVRAPAT